MRKGPEIFVSFVLGLTIGVAFLAALIRLYPAPPAAAQVPAQYKELADRWMFVETLRKLGGLCHYRLLYSPTIGLPAVNIWEMQLRGGGWEGNSYGPQNDIKPGVTLRLHEGGGLCANQLLPLFKVRFPKQVVAFGNQQSEFLNACGSECVQIEMNY